MSTSAGLILANQLRIIDGIDKILMVLVDIRDRLPRLGKSEIDEEALDDREDAEEEEDAYHPHDDRD